MPLAPYGIGTAVELPRVHQHETCTLNLAHSQNVLGVTSAGCKTHMATCTNFWSRDFSAEWPFASEQLCCWQLWRERNFGSQARLDRSNTQISQITFGMDCPTQKINSGCYHNTSNLLASWAFGFKSLICFLRFLLDVSVAKRVMPRQHFGPTWTQTSLLPLGQSLSHGLQGLHSQQGCCEDKTGEDAHAGLRV